MARASIARKTTGGMAPRRKKAKEAAAVRLRRRQSQPDFTKATKSRRGQELDVVSAGNNEAQITVPIQFLVYGRCDSAAYVLDMIHLCFVERGALMGSTTQAVLGQSQAIPTLPNLDVLFCRDDGTQIRTGRRVEGPRVEPVKWPAEHEAPVGFADTALRRQDVALAFKTAVIARDGTESVCSPAHTTAKAPSSTSQATATGPSTVFFSARISHKLSSRPDETALEKKRTAGGG